MIQTEKFDFEVYPPFRWGLQVFKDTKQVDICVTCMRKIECYACSMVVDSSPKAHLFSICNYCQKNIWQVKSKDEMAFGSRGDDIEAMKAKVKKVKKNDDKRN